MDLADDGRLYLSHHQGRSQTCERSDEARAIDEFSQDHVSQLPSFIVPEEDEWDPFRLIEAVSLFASLSWSSTRSGQRQGIINSPAYSLFGQRSTGVEVSRCGMDRSWLCSWILSLKYPHVAVPFILREPTRIITSGRVDHPPLVFDGCALGYPTPHPSAKGERSLQGGLQRSIARAIDSYHGKSPASFILRSWQCQI